MECWVAVTTEAFSQALLSEKPLTKDGAYVPQTHAYLTDTAGRIWTAVRDTLKPFISKQFRYFLLVLRICLNQASAESLHGGFERLVALLLSSVGQDSVSILRTVSPVQEKSRSRCTCMHNAGAAHLR